MARLIWQIALASMLMSDSVTAAEVSALNGTWGTPAQCARSLLVEGGSKTAEPFEIRDGWLKHGQTWCVLTWFPTQQFADNSQFTAARATCGEDSQRHYGLGFRLEPQEGGETLTIIWDEALINGPLARCKAH